MTDRNSSFLLLCVVFFVFGIVLGSSYDFLSSNNGVEGLGDVFQAPARRSLLSTATKEPETALVAALDGTVYLLEVGSMKPLWSFSSGQQIYSSYQVPINDKENGSGIESNYYIDCGDDWELYAHNNLGKLKLMKSIEEYISSTPQIAEDGGVVLGSKITTAFLVDARTGRIMHTYRMSNPSSAMSWNTFLHNMTAYKQPGSESELKADELPLYITRTDYTLTSFMRNSDKVLWNMTVAEIGAAFLCQDVENSFGHTIPELEYSETDLPYNMPLPCHSRSHVYRFRSHNMLELLSKPHGLPKAFHQDLILPAYTSDVLPSQPNVDKLLGHLPSSFSGDKSEVQNNKDVDSPLPTTMSNENCTVTDRQHHRKFSKSRLIILFIVPLVLFVSCYQLVSRIKDKLAVPSPGTNSTNIHSKRKKYRQTGKSPSNSEKDDEENDEKQGKNEVNRTLENDENFWLNLMNQPISRSMDGRSIGKLVVSQNEIAKGSNGTIVLEGMHEGRLVAVKRLVKACHDVAIKEIENLIISDCHPNIVRWYGVEQDQDFVYIALERCACSLNDLVLMNLESFSNPTLVNNLEADVAAECPISLGSLKGVLQKVELWNSDAYPSQLLLKLMRDITSGVAHLHELGIVHRDLKPQNVLITWERSVCAKISDMGISKRLVGDMSSFSNHATGCGSPGWQAPELLLNKRQTVAVDLFSLGCVFFFCMTGGRHPFGDRLERDINIVKNKVDLFLVEHIPEALDLISRLLDPSAEMRPGAVDVLHHPLFWSADVRLSFFRDASDRMELEDREIDSDLFISLERIAPIVFGSKWNEKMDPLLLNDIRRYRRYKFDSVRDLLRVMRNKLSHYRELPVEVQDAIGGVPEGFDMYFRRRFPKLLIEVYKVMFKYCRSEECLSKYFNGTPQ